MLTFKTWFQEYATNEEELVGSALTLTAHAGGGQGSATAMTTKFNIFTTVAAALDSCKLPAALIGEKCFVLNLGADTLEIFTENADYLDNQTSNSITIEPGECAIFESPSDQYWFVAYKTESAQNIVLSKNITLSSAEILALNSTPKLIVPAPGVGFAIEVISASCKFTKAGSNYASGGAISLLIDTASSGQLLLGSSFTSASNFFEKFQDSAGPVNLVENKKLTITNASSDFINGSGTAVVYVCYRIITL